MLIIEVKKGNIEGALKQFKSKVIKTKLVPQLQERKTYKKNLTKIVRLLKMRFIVKKRNQIINP